MLITNFQLGNSNVKITQECRRKEENNASCPKHKSNALHTHMQNQTTLFLLWSGLWLLGKCIAEDKGKNIVELLVQALTLLKHALWATQFPVRMYQIIVFKATSENTSDDLTLHQWQ